MGICALEDITPVFAELAKALYGEAVDPRELWDLAKNMDSSEVHVNGAVKPKKPHSNAARALVLGAAAESAATFRAGQQAHAAVTAPRAIGEQAGKLRALSGGRAAKVGEFGLQAANLGIGLTAAHKLSANAKKKAVVSKAAFGWLRPVKQVMTDDQAARHTAALKRAAHMGDRIVAGAALGGTAVVAHRVGFKAGRKRGAAQGLEVSKAVLRPVNGVKAANAGGLSGGLGRHGRLIGGKTPAPVLQPVARAMPKKIVDNTVTKSLTWTGEISKVDTDKRTVFGWCSLSKVDGKEVVDLQGDYVPLEEIEKSAYRYVIESRKGGDMHKRVSKFDVADEPLHTADLIESFVVTPDKLEQLGLAPDALPLGWWIGMKVNDDEQWARVKSGERRAFSIHGTGARTEMAA